MGKAYKPAVVYLRTSSAANVGADKDSDKRQRAAIEAFAKRAGMIIAEYYDKAVSERPAFGGKADSKFCSDGSPLLTHSGHYRLRRSACVRHAQHLRMLSRLGTFGFRATI
jgi:Resolvase, N terminal domain